MPNTSISEEEKMEQKSVTSSTRTFGLHDTFRRVRNSLLLHSSVRSNDNGSTKDSGSVKNKGENKDTDKEVMIFTPGRMMLASEDQRLPLTKKELEKNLKRMEQEKVKKKEEKAAKKLKKKEEKVAKKLKKKEEKAAKKAKKGEIRKEAKRRVQDLLKPRTPARMSL